MPSPFAAALLLLVAAAPAAGPATRAQARPISEFKPARDGFAFPNAFPGFPGKSTLFDRPGNSYGLCGGMSFAAADFFLARQTVPAAGDAPAKNSPLWTYLYRRQLDSVGDGQTARFIEWTQLEDTGKDTVASRTRRELAAAVRKIDAGEPALLGLILAKGSFNIFTNHQVLAFSHETKDGVTTLRVYDPNAPRNDARILRAEPITVTIDGEKVDQLNVSQGNAGGQLQSFRGFFVLPYKPAEPPEDLRAK